MIDRVVSISKTAGSTPVVRWKNRVLSVVLTVVGWAMVALIWTSIVYSVASIGSAAGGTVVFMAALSGVVAGGIMVQSTLDVWDVFRTDFFLHKHRANREDTK